MANVYISVNQGADGQPDEITEGSSSTAGNDVELRIAVPGAGGSNLFRSDIYVAVEQILRYILDGRTTTLTE